MRTALNRIIPLDVIARWWYLLVAGGALGLIISQITRMKPFSPLLKGFIAEGPPSGIQVATKWVSHPGWRNDLFFTVIGFLLACGVIWLLEEIRMYRQRSAEL